MAIITPAKQFTFGRTHRVTWSNLTNGDTGEPWPMFGAADATIHVFGTFTGSGTVTMQGSLEAVPATYFTLKDPQGNTMVYTDADAEMISQVGGFIRPSVTGDGTTSITIIGLFRSTM